MLIFIPQRKEVYRPQAIQNLNCTVLAHRLTEYTTSARTGRLKVHFNESPSKYQQNTLFICKILKKKFLITVKLFTTTPVFIHYVQKIFHRCCFIYMFIDCQSFCLMIFLKVTGGIKIENFQFKVVLF